MKMFSKSALMLGLLLAAPSFAQSGTGSQTDPKTPPPTTAPDSTKSTGSDSRSPASERATPGSDDSLGSGQKKKSERARTTGMETGDTADTAKSDTKGRKQP
jgi:hypothetical protein